MELIYFAIFGSRLIINAILKHSYLVNLQYLYKMANSNMIGTLLSKYKIKLDVIDVVHYLIKVNILV